MTDIRYSNRASSFLEGIEASFGRPIRDVATMMRKACSRGPAQFAATRFDEFLDTYCFQLVEGGAGLATLPPPPKTLAQESRRQLTTKVDDWLTGLPVLDPGDTRPLVRLRVGDNSPWGARYPAGDAKTVMLYSRQLILMDPMPSFSKFWLANSSGLHRKARLHADEAALALTYARSDDTITNSALEGLSREEWLTRAIEQYASLESAIRKGYVESLFIDPSSQWASWRPGEHHVRIWEVETGLKRDKQKIAEASRDILLAIGIAARSPGIAHPVARPGFQESLLEFYRPLFEPNSRGAKTPVLAQSARERAMLSRLFELNLDGVDFTKVKDLVAVRDSDTFSEVRGTIREAVAAAEQETTQPDAQAAAREILADKANIKPRAIEKSISNALVSKAVILGLGGWASIATSSWQPLLPTLAQGAIDVVKDAHQQKALKAQRSIYLALSRTKEIKELA